MEGGNFEVERVIFLFKNINILVLLLLVFIYFLFSQDILINIYFIFFRKVVDNDVDKDLKLMLIIIVGIVYSFLSENQEI